ncbi:MAG: heparinase II/III family protein [Chthoniobacterales bacterium]
MQHWTKQSPKQLRSLIPDKEAHYRYGLGDNLDPIHKKKLLWAGRNNPFQLKASDGTLYPNDSFPDSGSGWSDKSGQIYYFAQLANGLRIADIEKNVLPELAQAYLLTGDEKYAETAAVLLDAIASIYPNANEGPLDYPGNRAEKAGGGRLQRPLYQAARALINYAWVFSVFETSKPFTATSHGNPDLTVSENIKKNLFANGAEYCQKKAAASLQLNNGLIDYIRGTLIANAAAGKGPASEANLPLTFDEIITNTVDPQGGYVETSTSYAEHTMLLLLSWADALEEGRAENDKSPSPYDNRRFANLCLSYPSDVRIAGRTPLFGDSGPDRQIVTQDDLPDYTIFYRALSFYLKTTDSEIRQMAEKMIRRFAPKDWTSLKFLTELSPRNEHHTELRKLVLKNKEKIAALPEQTEYSRQDSAVSTARLFPESGLAILTNGVSETKETAALLRFGPTRNHGQHDELGLQFYANGQEYSFDPGYYNTHLRFGFTRTTVAHNTVVVNRSNQLREASQGGTIESWTNSSTLRSVTASDPAAYSSIPVSVYKRRVALLSLGKFNAIIDHFQVRGGSEYDYSLHGPSGAKFTMPGLDALKPQAGSAASSEVNFSKDLLATGVLSKPAGKPFYWATPFSGFGFLSSPRILKAGQAMTGRWDGGTNDASLLIHSFPPKESEIIVASSPQPPAKMNVEYVLQHVQSTPEKNVSFLSVLTMGTSDTVPPKVRKLLENSDGSTAIEIIPDDSTPQNAIYFLGADNTDFVSLSEDLSLRGEEICLIRDASQKITSVVISGEGAVRMPSFELSTQSLIPENTNVQEVMQNPLRIRLSQPLVDADRLAQSAITIRNPAGDKRQVFLVKEISQNENQTVLQLDGDSDLVAIGKITAHDALGLTFTTSAFLPKFVMQTDFFDPDSGLPDHNRRQVNIKDAKIYKGFRIVLKNAAGDITATRTLTNIDLEKKEIQLDSPVAAAADVTFFEIHSIALGGTITSLPWAEATRNSADDWTVQGPAKISLKK